jgi:SH3-like domain-containing protein
MRTGPGTRYPIDWVYRRRGLPMEVIDEFDTWRRVRDSEGTSGWVHQSMLQGRRRVLVIAEGVSLRRDPQDDSRPVAMLEPGVIATLESCGGEWCVLEIDSYKGWVKRSEVFGVYPDEDVN